MAFRSCLGRRIALAGLLAATLGGPGAAEDRARPAPLGYELVDLGETIEFGDGHSITVSLYEDNVPYEAESVVGRSQGVANLWYARICAGDSPLQNFVSEIYFTAFRGADGVSVSGMGHVVPGVRKPRLNEGYVPTSPDPGTCVEGWVVAGATDASSVLPGATAVCFDSSRIGAVSDELQVKYAWKLE